jgi:hypothetical protein
MEGYELLQLFTMCPLLVQLGLQRVDDQVGVAQLSLEDEALVLESEVVSLKSGILPA